MDLPFAVIFSGVNRLSNTLSNIGSGFSDVGSSAQTASAHLADFGERMVRVGEGMTIASALASEGANKLHEWGEALQEPAIDMQKNMATMAAMTGLAGDQLAAVKQRAVEFSSIHPGTTADEWVSGFTRMQGIFHDTQQAMKAEDITAMLKRLGVDNDAATKLIQVAWSNLRTDSATTGDQLTKAIQTVGLAPEAANQVATAVGRMGASAATAHAPFSEVIALTGEAQRLLGGGRGATMFVSMIEGLEKAANKGKATIDFSHGLIAALQQLKAQIAGTPMEKLAPLQEMGISNAPQMLNLLNNLDEVAAKQKQIGNSSGALSKAHGIATANMADATARLHQNWSNLADAISTPALSIQARATNVMSDAISGLSRITEHHSKIAGEAAISLGLIGSAAYHGLNAMSSLGTSFIFLGYAQEGVAKAWPGVKAAFSSIGTISTTAMTLPNTFTGIASATKFMGRRAMGARSRARRERTHDRRSRRRCRRARIRGIRDL